MIKFKMKFEKADCVIGWDTKKSVPVRVGKGGKKMLRRFKGEIEIPLPSAPPKEGATLSQPIIVTKKIENEAEFISAAYYIGSEFNDTPLPA